jgi:FGGY family of carbohydrate kinases, N-terminal domain
MAGAAGGDSSSGAQQSEPRSEAQYIAAIDQGTSSTRCIIFSKAGTVKAVHQLEHTQYYPQPGWVEHDALGESSSSLSLSLSMHKLNLPRAERWLCTLTHCKCCACHGAAVRAVCHHVGTDTLCVPDTVVKHAQKTPFPARAERANVLMLQRSGTACRSA